MAITVSGLFLDAYIKQLNQQSWTGTGGLNFTLATWKGALISNSATPNFSAASPSWSSTNEVFGTGWPTGGILLSAISAGATSSVPTLAEGTTGSIRYDMGDVSVAGTTLSAARAFQIYAANITAPYANPLVLLINFGADYSTVAGNFGIQFSATGMWEDDITP